MPKCSICGEETGKYSPIMCIDVNNYKNICENCAQRIESVENGNLKGEEANYLKNILEEIVDFEVQDYLKNLLRVEEHMQKEKISNFGEELNEEEFFYETSNNNGASGSVWISGMKTFAYITFIALLIGGIVLAGIIGGASNGGIGFLVFLISIVIGYLSVAGIMIFLDMASDIREIRLHITKEDK